MKTNKEIRIYNMILPIWMLVFFPTPLWLLLIPVNFLIDYLVLYLNTSGLEDRRRICRRAIWPLCLFGFLSDLAGAAPLFFLSNLDLKSQHYEKFAESVMWDPFSNALGFLAVVGSILLAGIAIYLLDYHLLKNDQALHPGQAKKIARNLAIFTAPYIYLLPTALFGQ